MVNLRKLNKLIADYEKELEDFYKLMDEKKYGEALDNVEKVIQGGATDNTSLASMFVCQGDALRKLGRTDEAVEAYKKSIADMPGFRAVSGLSEIYLEQGKGPEAVPILKDYLKEDLPDDSKKHLEGLLSQAEKK